MFNDILKTSLILILFTFIIGWLIIKITKNENYRNIFLFLLKKIHYVILYGVILCVVVIILLIIFLPPPSDESITARYKHLVDQKHSSYETRVLDEGDEMPEIYCVKNKKEILKVLSNKDLIGEMIKSLVISNAPCVASYHFKKKNETKMPNFIMLNKRFYTINGIGKVVKFISKFTGLTNNFYINTFIESYGKKSHQGEYYYIFNLKIIGGSKKKNMKVERHTSLCRWSGNTKKNNHKFSLQIDCVEAIFYNNNIHIEDSLLLFRGNLAYCIENFDNDISNKKIC